MHEQYNIIIIMHYTVMYNVVIKAYIIAIH